MNNKTLLPLMEQLIMILIFSLAAALCLQGFSAADRMSKRQEVLNEAAATAQNTADMLKSTLGDYELTAELLGGTVLDEGLQIQTEDYILVASSIDEDLALLSSADIQIFYQDESVFKITVSWQEDIK